ncbi:hypothetical protein B0H17DRAFT_1125648 [Mycena rosella]|uniref:Uncharacterized protein n=1 Tax=Mycena rosella TaxID=1033263 RepID=A0AAD7GWI0_MYCRO|nr:hypothetical protein B0H17DRAFT_1125648 [Mycena rosella]
MTTIHPEMRKDDISGSAEPNAEQLSQARRLNEVKRRFNSSSGLRNGGIPAAAFSRGRCVVTLSSPGKIPAPFARFAGPDEGIDDLSQQMGVRHPIPVRAAPTTKGKGARKGKEKEATWPAETSSVKPPRKERKVNSDAAVASGSGSAGSK